MNNSIELEMKMATQLLWAPCASKSISKKEISGAAGEINPHYQGETGLLLHNENKEECLKYRRSLKVSISITKPCD